MPGENLSSHQEPDPRALAIAVQFFPDAACQAEKRGIHTFVDVDGTTNPLDAGLYIFDDINIRLINVIKRQDGATAALGRVLSLKPEGGSA